MKRFNFLQREERSIMVNNCICVQIGEINLKPQMNLFNWFCIEERTDYMPCLVLPSFFVSALVITWVTIPMGQNRRHRETECRVSISFSNPSWNTCLDKSQRCKVLNLEVKETGKEVERERKLYLAAKRSTANKWIQAEANVISLENILAIPDNCVQLNQNFLKLPSSQWIEIAQKFKKITDIYVYVHTSGNQYLVANIRRSVSGVQERYRRYAYRSPSTTYGMLLSIDFLVCITHNWVNYVHNLKCGHNCFTRKVALS